MPSEQPPAQNPGSTRQGPAEKLQHPPASGGVRMLLGLPFGDRSTPSTVALTAPSGRQGYAQSPLPAPGESDECFGEVSPDEGSMEEARGTVDDDVPERDGAPFSRAGREHTAEVRSTLEEPSTEQRAQTHLVIPGVSTHRTAFPTLSHTADTPTCSLAGQPPHAVLPPAAPLHAPASLPGAHEMTTSDVALLTRLEQLVTDGASVQKGLEARSRGSVPLSPSPLEHMGMQNGERGGQDLAQRVEHLQRTVRDLVATVSAQATRHRDDRQAQRRERQMPPLQRMVIMKRSSEASSTTPRAFWERSRLGRFYLQTGR